MGNNLYRVLGVPINATKAEIKLAYRKLVKKYHPDINKDDKAAIEKFKELQFAYSILFNDKERKAYDEKLTKKREEKKRTTYQRKSIIRKEQKDYYELGLEESKLLSNFFSIIFFCFSLLFISIIIFLNIRNFEPKKTEYEAPVFNDKADNISTHNSMSTMGGKIISFKRKGYPLLEAIVNKQYKKTIYIVKYKNNKDLEFIDGPAYVLLAIKNNWPDVVGSLIKEGFLSKDDVDDSYNPMDYAYSKGLVDVLNVLEDNGFKLGDTINTVDYDKSMLVYLRSFGTCYKCVLQDKHLYDDYHYPDEEQENPYDETNDVFSTQVGS